MATSKRPKLKLAWSKIEIAIEVFCLITLGLAPILLAMYWNQLPETSSAKVDISRQPIDWAPHTVLAVLAAIDAFIYIVLTIVAQFPHTYNYPWPITENNAESQYRMARKFLTVIKFEINSVLLFSIWGGIALATKLVDNVDTTTIVPLMAMVFVTIFIYRFIAPRLNN